MKYKSRSGMKHTKNLDSAKQIKNNKNAYDFLSKTQIAKRDEISGIWGSSRRLKAMADMGGSLPGVARRAKSGSQIAKKSGLGHVFAKASSGLRPPQVRISHRRRRMASTDPEVFVENVGQNKINLYDRLISAFIFICLTALNQNVQAVLTVSQYKPDSYFQKPYFQQDDFANFSAIFSGGFASQAYNQTGQKVPYLQQFGSENLLKRFTDTSLPNNDIDSFGQGQLTGEFHVREMILSAYKNMVNGFFIEGATAIQDIFIDAISVEFVDTSTPLTDDQISYLQDLQQKMPTSIERSGMFTTAVYAGFSKTFLNFTHLDFIDLTIKTGFMSPQAMSNSNTSILQLPLGNMNFGYPVIAAASVGVLDWITVGCNASVVPWQSATKTIPMNNTLSGNNLLLSQSGVAMIQRGPLLAASLYFEADHFHQGLSGTIAYSYTKNCAYTITPIDHTQFPAALVNQSALFDSWSLGSLYMQFDIDFACEARPNAAVITIFCNIPLTGQLCPKTTIFGGSCSLQLSYIF